VALYHPSYKLEDPSIKSSYDVEKHERFSYSEANGWKKLDIEGHVLCHCHQVIALEF
jgi:hypothetical protein